MLIFVKSKNNYLWKICRHTFWTFKNPPSQSVSKELYYIDYTKKLYSENQKTLESEKRDIAIIQYNYKLVKITYIQVKLLPF